MIFSSLGPISVAIGVSISESVCKVVDTEADEQRIAVNDEI